MDWGNFILKEEKGGLFDWAVATYRKLKQWHTNAGMYDIAGKFFYREMEAKRKAQSWKREPLSKLWSWMLRLLCGYGEKYESVVVSAIVIIFSLAIAYFIIGTLEPNAFLDCLYYSFVSFTAVGYGSWVKESFGWVKWLGVAETIL